MSCDEIPTVKLFSLKPGDKFAMGERIFTIKRFIETRRPGVGKVPQCECIKSDGTGTYFIINHDVIFI